jgi:hypothetical protein
MRLHSCAVVRITEPQPKPQRGGIVIVGHGSQMAAELQTPLSELLHTGHVRDPVYLVKRRFVGTPILLRLEPLRLGQHRLLDTAGNGMPPAVSVGNLAMGKLPCNCRCRD